MNIGLPLTASMSILKQYFMNNSLHVYFEFAFFHSYSVTPSTYNIFRFSLPKIFPSPGLAHPAITTALPFPSLSKFLKVDLYLWPLRPSFSLLNLWQSGFFYCDQIQPSFLSPQNPYLPERFEAVGFLPKLFTPFKYGGIK